MGRVRINSSTRVVENQITLSSHVDNEIVILNIPKGEYNGLDEIGTRIWNELESPIVVADLVRLLMEKLRCGRTTVHFRCY